MNLFHLMHVWELMREYGAGGGLLLGLYVGLKKQHFPIMSAIGSLANLEGSFAIQGGQLIYTVNDLQLPTGGHFPHDYVLHLWPLFGWVIACSFVGGLIGEGISQKLDTPATTKPAAGTEPAQKQAEPKKANEEDSSKKNGHA